MRFNPLNEEEAAKQSSGLFDPGLYDYEIAEAAETTSNSGNDMIKLTVLVFDRNGDHKRIWFYLVNTQKSQWKIREFARSCGLLDSYNNGSLSETECVGCTGQCELGIEPAQGQWPAKNVISSWLPKKTARGTGYTGRSAPQPASAQRASGLDDEIPF